MNLGKLVIMLQNVIIALQLDPSPAELNRAAANLRALAEALEGAAKE